MPDVLISSPLIWNLYENFFLLLQTVWHVLPPMIYLKTWKSPKHLSLSHFNIFCSFLFRWHAETELWPAFFLAPGYCLICNGLDCEVQGQQVTHKPQIPNTTASFNQPEYLHLKTQGLLVWTSQIPWFLRSSSPVSWTRCSLDSEQKVKFFTFSWDIHSRADWIWSSKVTQFWE